VRAYLQMADYTPACLLQVAMTCELSSTTESTGKRSLTRYQRYGRDVMTDIARYARRRPPLYLGWRCRILVAELRTRLKRAKRP
jgi:hypothetical protein